MHASQDAALCSARGTTSIGTSCGLCGLSSQCPTNILRQQGGDEGEDWRPRQRRYAKEAVLFTQGDTADRVLMLKSGALKSICVDIDGIETVSAFHFPGDLVGIQAIQFDRYPVTLVALEPTVVCEVRPNDFSRHLTASNRLLLRMLETLLDDQMTSTKQYQFVTHASADARVAFFILRVLERLERASRRTDAIRLPMSRSDISSHLGIAPETTSRCLRKFQRLGVLEIHGKEIRIISRRELLGLARMR